MELCGSNEEERNAIIIRDMINNNKNQSCLEYFTAQKQVRGATCPHKFVSESNMGCPIYIFICTQQTDTFFFLLLFDQLHRQLLSQSF